MIETDAQMIEGYYRQNQIEMILERALRERSIQVYYQPIYSLKEKRIVSLEALARLFDGELGYIPPAEFIPIAEKNGDIIRIGEIVLEECCKFLSKHVLSNMSLGIRSIQINISVAQCMQQNLKEADPAEVPYPNLHDRAGTDGEHCDQCTGAYGTSYERIGRCGDLFCDG